MSFSQLVQLARKYYNEAQALQDEYDQCVAAAEAGKREKSSCAKRVLEVAGAPPSPPPSTPSCAAYVAAGSGMGAEVGLAACDYLHARTEELDAQEDYKRGKDAYRGAKTYCGAHKVGFFFGYPAMFNASTYVESMSSPNQAKRDITPVMAHGVVVAPNALVALTAGSWVGMVDVSSTETAVVWGFTAGAALTADVFSLIR